MIKDLFIRIERDGIEQTAQHLRASPDELYRALGGFSRVAHDLKSLQVYVRETERETADVQSQRALEHGAAQQKLLNRIYRLRLRLQNRDDMVWYLYVCMAISLYFHALGLEGGFGFVWSCFDFVFQLAFC